MSKPEVVPNYAVVNVVLVVLVVVLFLDDNRDNLGQLDFLLSMLFWLLFNF